MKKELIYLPLTALHAGQYQPRQNFDMELLNELAASISSQGLIEPLIVRHIARNSYEIIAGERRWRAAKIAGLTEVPCIVGEYTDKQASAVTLIENIQRQDLNVLEEASAYRRLMDEFHYRQDELAILIGKSRSHIANSIRLLSLSPKVKAFIIGQGLSYGHARTLIGLDACIQEELAQKCMEEQWSVRQLEQNIKDFKNPMLSQPKDPRKDREVERLETILAEQVGAPVQIVSDVEAGGWLKVKFFDNDTLAGLLERLGLRYD